MKTGIEMIAERESKIFTANGMSREELRLNYNAACNAYLAAFARSTATIMSRLRGQVTTPEELQKLAIYS